MGRGVKSNQRRREGAGGKLDRNSRNSVYSHFNTNPQPQNNQKNNISKQHRKEARAGEVQGNYKIFHLHGFHKSS